MLQLLCLIAMDPPVSLEADRVRDEKLKVLRALKPMQPHEVASHTVRGQYTQGAIDGKPVPSYLTDLGSSEASNTERFVALKAEVRTWRWAGVPFYLRTGKRLPTKVSEIVIQFPRPAVLTFSARNRRVAAEHIDHSPAAGRRHAAGDDDQGSGSRRVAAVADRPRHQLSKRRSASVFRMPMNGC